MNMYTIKLYICKVELTLSVQFCTNVRTYVTTFDNYVQNVYITQNRSLCPLLFRPLHTHARTLRHPHFSRGMVASPKEQGLFSSHSPSALLCLACFACSHVLTMLRDGYGQVHIFIWTGGSLLPRQLPGSSFPSHV